MIRPNELTWVARYNSGHHVQYNAEGEYQDKYADIDRENLKYFELWTVKPYKCLIRLHFDTPDKRLIWRRRVFKKTDGSEIPVYLIGWQITVGEQNIQSINVVFPDGHIEQIDKWQEDNPIFESPIPHPHEGENWTLPQG